MIYCQNWFIFIFSNGGCSHYDWVPEIWCWSYIFPLRLRKYYMHYSSLSQVKFMPVKNRRTPFITFILPFFSESTFNWCIDKELSNFIRYFHIQTTRNSKYCQNRWNWFSDHSGIRLTFLPWTWSLRRLVGRRESCSFLKLF